jgi:hypothetical protein
MRPWRGLVPVFSLAVATVAQGPAWKLPPGGLACYEAEEALEPDPPGGVLPACPLPHATILLQSELAADQRHSDLDVQDWRWIAPHLAFDLRLSPARLGGKLPRIAGLGDLDWTAKVEAPATGGSERYTITWKVVPPVLTPDERKLLAGDKKPWYGGSGKGTLDLERTVDAEAGVVREFRATLGLDVVFGPHHGGAPLRGTFAQHWRLDTVRGWRDPDFQARIDDAIVAGADVIEHALRLERPEFATRKGDAQHLCGEGLLALAIQTLLVAQRAPDENPVRDAIAELLRRDIEETYSLAVAIQTLEVAAAPANERDNLLRGLLPAPTPRELSPFHAERIAEWTTRLLRNRDLGVDPAYRSRWWYVGGKGFDNSNTQYALLGLWSASLCRQEVSRGVWHASADHWLAVQHPAESRAVALHLQPLADLVAGTAPRGAPRTVPPRGFSYRAPGDGPAYGSMTCAGIAGMSLCRAGLLAGQSKNASVDDRIDDGIRAAFAWLLHHRTVRWNAGPPPHRNLWYFYWLYSLERACELSRVGRIGTWDWYHEGAQVLLALQDGHGAFGRANLEEQCFAVLFLKKAQLPVLTGPR